MQGSNDGLDPTASPAGGLMSSECLTYTFVRHRSGLQVYLEAGRQTSVVGSSGFILGASLTEGWRSGPTYCRSGRG